MYCGAWTYEMILTGLLWILKVTKARDVQITCVFSERCTLPCSFEPYGHDEVIHWYNTKNNDNPVHSYYQGNNQLAHQDPKYKGRTSLFLDQIASGNASLSLTDVKVQDGGRYKCYTSSTKGNDEKFVKLQIQAPVKLVDITVDTNTLTCRSEGIYPDPSLEWSTAPKTDAQAQEAQKQEDVQGLFSITSTLHMNSNTTYTCKVTAGTNTQTTSLRKHNLNAKSGWNLIPCSISEKNTNLKDFRLTWLFNRNSTILTFDTHTFHPKVDDQWQRHVDYKNGQTEIQVNNLNDPTLRGTYRCEVSTAKFRHLEETVILQSPASSSSGESTIAWVVGSVVVCLVVIAAIIAVVCWRKMRNKESNSGSGVL